MNCSLIPAPTQIDFRPGFKHLSRECGVFIVGNGESALNLLQSFLILKSSSFETADIRLIQNSGLKEQTGNEGYLLSINSENIEIKAAKPAGLLYGVESLRQLFPAECELEFVPTSLSCIEVFDKPRFGWRGFMLDSSRHFHGVPEIKKILDIMALHKMNRFHWHLTDDQGWRLEIKKYPDLTRIGSQRGRTELIDKCSYRDKTHSGFFTQKEIREIIDYARSLHIMVIPELDIPGHSSAALAAYPEVSCTGEAVKVEESFGIFDNIYCAGKEKSFHFLQDIFDEICDLFDSPYIHIGGDEASVKNWENCPDCQKRIRKLGLENAHQLQAWFFNRISAYLLDKGKLPIAWNEAISNDLDERIVIQHWIPDNGRSLEQLKNGRPMILSRLQRVYLDYAYSTTTLKACYTPPPFSEEFKGNLPNNMMGIEAPLWTEWVDTPERLYWQLLPRLTAVAECAWSQPDKLDWESFLRRLKKFTLKLNALGVAPASEKFWRKEHNGIEDISEDTHKKVLLEIEKDFQSR